jgi:hypothetical protein
MSSIESILIGVWKLFGIEGHRKYMPMKLKKAALFLFA